ncbi:MAG: amylo-alpha-1,6-glucosidase [Bacteroidales bacterium]
MSYINFDKLQLVNLEYSLSKELLRSNRAGAFSSTTIIGCNTRKYHGLLIVKQPDLDGEHHILLSSVDESIVQQQEASNFGLHRYKGGYYNPKGHKYVRDFITEPIPKVLYRVGGVFLTKESLFSHDEARIIIKYTLEDAHSPTLLRLKPFLAFRNRHSLSKANIFADTKYEGIPQGIRMKLYEHYSPLNMQISAKNDYIHVPDWYYDIEYIQELERGYDYLEDLFVPGYFEIPLKKGESIYFTAGLDEINPKDLKKLFDIEVNRRIPRNNFENCLINSAHQFFTRENGKTRVVAGFPWYNSRVRDTLVAVPGLSIIDGRIEKFKDAIDTLVSGMIGPYFAQEDNQTACAAPDADTALWLFWTLQQLVKITGKKSAAWKEYGPKLKEILTAYRDGYCGNIRMSGDFLIDATDPARPLTWMDAIVDGKPVTHRKGKAVEVNALWYNAVMFALELAAAAKDKSFIDEWQNIASGIKQSFTLTFWNESKGYLADCVFDGKPDWSFRPNQVFAASLPYSPLPEEICKQILDKIKVELVTIRGLRSLSPQDPGYIGVYQGDQARRDHAAHQGTVYPWLFGAFVEGYLKIHGKGAVSAIKKLFKGFEDTIREHGIGSISELYDGDPPHWHGGAISMAWSVGEVLRAKMLIDEYESKNE